MFEFLKRDKSQPAKRVVPGFSGAQQAMHKRFAAARSDRLTTRTQGMGLSVDEALRRDVVQLRGASRKAGEDVGYVKKYFGMVQTHVIGDKGVSLQAEIRTKNGDLDKDANIAIEAGFKEWGRLGVCEISGRMNWISAQQLIAKTVSQDGDVIIRHIDGAPNKYGYAFQIIEADLLDASLYKILANGNRIKMGVEIDAYGRHVAYHLLTNHPGEYTWSTGGRRYIRVPASEIILPFPMWRPGQNRGVPWAHAALLDMHDIAGFRESTLVSSRIGASNMLVYERDPDQEPPETNPNGEDGWDEAGEFLQEIEPGASTIAPPGYKMRETNFRGPDSSMGDFQKAALRGAASGLEANYNVVGNDYEGVSWSSLRQAILEDREHWKRMQGWFISQVANAIYDRWRRNALLVGAIDGLGAFDLRRTENYTFRGRRWSWVDPLKDEQAVGEAMKNFTINPLEILNDKGVDLDQMAEGWTLFLDAMQANIERAQVLGYGHKVAVKPEQRPEPSDKED